MELGVSTFADVRPSPGGPAVDPARRLREVLEEAELAEQVGPRRLRCRRAPPARLRHLRAGGRPRRRRRAHGEDPADEHGDGPQHRRSRAGPGGVRHRRPPLGRTRRDHGRAWVVHRVVPAVRLRPGRLRLALRREARAPAAAARVRAGHLGRAPPCAARRSGRLPAAAPGAAAGVGRGRRDAGVGRARRNAGAADDARHHRRHAGALRPVRGAPPEGGVGRRPRPAAGARGQLAHVRCRDLASGPPTSSFPPTRR